MTAQPTVAMRRAVKTAADIWGFRPEEVLAEVVRQNGETAPSRATSAQEARELAHRAAYELAGL